MRLALAQYRELQAFAQFGSDLDKATQKTLARGERLTEILKQGQYVPMPFEEQIMVIYAGTSGGLDDVNAKKVVEFEPLYLQHMADTHPEVAKEIRSTGVLSDEHKAVLDEAINAVKPQVTG